MEADFKVIEDGLDWLEHLCQMNATLASEPLHTRVEVQAGFAINSRACLHRSAT
jgi:hypothetical protein